MFERHARILKVCEIACLSSTSVSVGTQTGIFGGSGTGPVKPSNRGPALLRGARLDRPGLFRSEE